MIVKLDLFLRNIIKNYLILNFSENNFLLPNLNII